MMEALKSAERKLTLAERDIEQARKEIETLKAEQQKLNYKMTQKHIAEYLGCSETTVWRKLTSGALKSKKAIDVIEYKIK